MPHIASPVSLISYLLDKFGTPAALVAGGLVALGVAKSDLSNLKDQQTDLKAQIAAHGVIIAQDHDTIIEVRQAQQDMASDVKDIKEAVHRADKHHSP